MARSLFVQPRSLMEGDLEDSPPNIVIGLKRKKECGMEFSPKFSLAEILERDLSL